MDEDDYTNDDDTEDNEEEFSSDRHIATDLSSDEEDEDSPRHKKADEKTWKPRVYKWRVERKR